MEQNADQVTVEEAEEKQRNKHDLPVLLLALTP
jgi:hypothetical protein